MCVYKDFNFCSAGIDVVYVNEKRKNIKIYLIERKKTFAWARDASRNMCSGVLRNIYTIIGIIYQARHRLSISDATLKLREFFATVNNRVMLFFRSVANLTLSTLSNLPLKQAKIVLSSV